VSGIRVDRCYCFGRTFAELKAVADATGAATVPALQRHVAFGQRCRLCHPYVRRMLRTGEAVFHEIVTEADEPGGAGYVGD
jgi:hypothetical protein